MLFGYPTGVQGNVVGPGVNELVIPNYKQTWADIRKLGRPAGRGRRHQLQVEGVPGRLRPGSGRRRVRRPAPSGRARGLSRRMSPSPRAGGRGGRVRYSPLGWTRPLSTRSQAAWKATDPSKSGAIGRVGGVALVLPVEPRRPSGASSSIHLRLRHHAVVQPVGDVLAGDAQGGPVPSLFSPTSLDVRHLRGSRPPGRPSARHSRGCRWAFVVELRLDFLLRPVSGGRPAGIVRMSSSGAIGRSSIAFCRELHVDLVVMESRAAFAAVGEGTQAGVGAGLSGGVRIFCSIIAAMRSGIAHMPLPICARRADHRRGPRRRCGPRRPGSRSAPFISPLRIHRPGLPSRCGSRRRCGPGSRC